MSLTRTLTDTLVNVRVRRNVHDVQSLDRQTRRDSVELH